jgi:hypothetical protein
MFITITIYYNSFLRIWHKCETLWKFTCFLKNSLFFRPEPRAHCWLGPSAGLRLHTWWRMRGRARGCGKSALLYNISYSCSTEALPGLGLSTRLRLHTWWCLRRRARGLGKSTLYSYLAFQQKHCLGFALSAGLGLHTWWCMRRRARGCGKSTLYSYLAVQ